MILVPCSDTKKSDGDTQASLDNLSFHEVFGDIRSKLCDYYMDKNRYYFFEREAGKDRHLNETRILDWQHCLPAYERYDGVMFGHVKPLSWTTDLSDVLFVSPLWGIIRPTDLIPDYTLEFTDWLSSRRPDQPLNQVTEFWKSAFSRLPDLFPDTRFTNLLFKTYRDVFPVSVKSLFKTPISGDQHGHQRGNWLNHHLQSRLISTPK